MFELKEKVALVTGGVSGIGLSIVKELLRNGVKGISIADVDEKSGEKLVKELEKEFGQKTAFIKTDVADKVQFEDAFKETIRTFGALDIVVNNAGILNDFHWEKEISININGNVNGNLLALDYIQKYRSDVEGVIVNIASIAGVSVNGFVPIYNASKHAVLGLSRSLGLKEHYNATNIKVISICPGPTTTTLTDYNRHDNRWLGKTFQDLHLKASSGMQYQPVSHVGEEIVKTISVAETGSIWVIDKSEPAYEIEIPFYYNMRKKNL